MPGFPRHTQSLDASRRKAGRRYRRGQRQIPVSSGLEITEDLEAALVQFAEITGDLKRYNRKPAVALSDAVRTLFFL